MRRALPAVSLLAVLAAPLRAAGPADGLEEMTGRLAALGSRLPGYSGNAQAVSIIKDALAGIPGVAVGTQKFMVPVLKEQPATLTLTTQEGRVLLETTVYALWPNGLYPSTCPEGIEGPLVYVGKGRLGDYDGKHPEGAVLLMDFDCGGEWLNGPLLGARAVLFIEPPAAYRGEAEAKFTNVWLDYPRYWLPKEQADRVQELAATGARASLRGACTFAPEIVENVYAFLPGNSEDFSSELVVVSAYVDTTSVVPALAPAAEAAGNLAVFLEVAAAVARKGSLRPVLFLVTNAHSNGLAGARYFYDLLNLTDEKTKKRLAQLRLDAYLLDAKVRMGQRLLETGDTESLRQVAGQLAARPASGRWLFGCRPAPTSRHGELWTLCEAAGLKALFRQQDEPDELVNLFIGEFKEFMSDREARLLDELAPLRVRSDLPAVEAARRSGLEDERRLASRSGAKLRGSEYYTGLSADEQARVDAAFAGYLGEYVDELRGCLERANLRIGIEEHNAALAAKLTGVKRMLWLGLDVSSHAQRLALFCKGYLYNQRGTPDRQFAPLAADLMRLAQEAEAELGATPGSMLQDAVRKVKGRDWSSFLACRLAMDAEVATTAGEAKDTRVKSRGISLAASGDARVHVDTPHDTLERLDMAALRRYRDYLVLYVPEVLKEDGLCRSLGLDDRFTNFCVLDGNAVRRGGVRSVFETMAVPQAVVQWYHWSVKTFTGVRAEFLEASDYAGRFHMPGIRYYNRVNIEAAQHDPLTGRPVYVMDKGQMNVPAADHFTVSIDVTEKYGQVKMFEARPLALFDLVDQRFLELLRALDVYDARRENVPVSFGCQARAEPVVVVWSKKYEILKVVLKKGQVGTRMALLNITDDEMRAGGKGLMAGRPVRGRGFALEETSVVPLTSYQAAKDMYRMDEWRLARLKEHNIHNRRIEGLHEEAGLYLEAAEEYRREGRFSRFVEAVRSAWGVESRAYPDVRNTQDDTVVGVVFYLFLVLPFAFFLERLLFGFTRIEHQILGFFGLFVATFLVLEQVHPAFDLANAPMIVLLAFIMLALSGIVIGIIYGKFTAELGALREETKGRQSADVNRLSASAVAVRLGISNMRRRKVRTFLTCLTIIILTFTVLSFSSIVPGISKPQVSLGVEAPYSGILLRNTTWSALDATVYPVMRNRYGGDFAVAPRAWYVSENPDVPTTVEITGPAGTSFLAKAAAGLSPDEDRLFNLKPTLLAGRWLKTVSGLECVLPRTVAEGLGFDAAAAVGSSVRMFGMEFTVVGVVQDERFMAITDLDGEELTPVDYQGEKSAGLSTTAARPEEVLLVDAALGKRYEHMLPGGVVIMPYETLLNAGGTLRSVAVGFPPEIDARQEVNRLLERIERLLYVGLDGESYLYSTAATTSFRGLKTLLVPLLIASLIVFNTMVGSVYERVREIGTLSALGLAPLHVGLLFLAESVVYAVLGAIAGYLLGQATAWGFTHISLLGRLFSGLELNYSSTATVYVTSLVMGAVVLSTLYPAVVAARIAVPSAERRWRVPAPVGDVLAMELPFTFSQLHVTGIMAFLKSFLYAHIDSTVGNFYVREVTFLQAARPSDFQTVRQDSGLSIEATAAGRQPPASAGYGVYFMAWLTPYDLGVSQEVQLLALPERDQFVMYLVLYRMSGYVSAWVRTNTPFLNALRKQLLLWRTLGEAERLQLADLGRGLFDNAQLGEVAPVHEARD